MYISNANLRHRPQGTNMQWLPMIHLKTLVLAYKKQHILPKS